jgi:hypothetical protein
LLGLLRPISDRGGAAKLLFVGKNGVKTSVADGWGWEGPLGSGGERALPLVAAKCAETRCRKAVGQIGVYVKVDGALRKAQAVAELDHVGAKLRQRDRLSLGLGIFEPVSDHPGAQGEYRHRVLDLALILRERARVVVLAVLGNEFLERGVVLKDRDAAVGVATDETGLTGSTAARKGAG